MTDATENVKPQPNLATAQEFVRLMSGEDDPVVRVRIIHDKDKDQPSAEDHGPLSKLWPDIVAAQDQGYGVFWLPNLCGFESDGFASDTDATRFPALFCDFDGNIPTQWHRQPDIIVHTSPGKCHAYWCVTDTDAEPDRWKHAERRLIAHYGSDPAIKNPSRVMRLPGTLHQKREPVLVTFDDHSEPDAKLLGETPPTIAEVLDGIADVSAAPTPAKAAEGVEIDGEAAIHAAIAYLKNCQTGTCGVDGNNTVFKHAATLKDIGISEERCVELMTQHFSLRCAPEWAAEELRAIVVNAYNYAQNEIGAKSPQPASKVFKGMKLPQIESPAIAENFGGVRFERMSDVRLEKITWTWRPRIPADMLSIIGGDPDCGKSTLVAGLIAAITIGGSLPLNGGKAEKGSVLVLNAEDGAAKILGPRLMAAGADMRLIHRVKPMVIIEDGARVFDLRYDLPNLEAKMQQLHEAGEPHVRLITIDPLNAYYGAGVDGNNAAELRRLLTPLAEWAEQNHITILGIHHLNKSNASGNAINRLNGSHAVGAAARSVILVTPERGDDGQETGRFLFMRGKNNLAPRNVKNLAYRIEARPVKMHDGGTEDHPLVVWDSEVAITATEAFDPNYGKGNKQDKAEAFLLSVLADGPVAVDELKRKAAERGIGWRTVETAKAKLSIRSDHKGFTKNSGWYWRLRSKEAEDAANDVNPQPLDPDDELLKVGLH